MIRSLRAQENWALGQLLITGRLPTDYVVDTVGGLKEAIAAVRMGGTVAFVGLLTGMSTELDLVALMGKSARVEAVDVGSKQMFEEMNKAIRFHGMRPVVDRVFGFPELGEALRYLAEAKHFGKVCLHA